MTAPDLIADLQKQDPAAVVVLPLNPKPFEPARQLLAPNLCACHFPNVQGVGHLIPDIPDIWRFALGRNFCGIQSGDRLRPKWLRSLFLESSVEYDRIVQKGIKKSILGS